MRLAVLSDIHGNLPALEAVLEDIGRREVEATLHLGDLVGYGPYPNEVVERVAALELPGVVGNYDLGISDADPIHGRNTFLRPDLSPVMEEIFRWTHARVTDETRGVLRQLPAQRYIEENGLTLCLTHGSPERPTEYLVPDTPHARLEALLDGTGADILVVGHTHLPMAVEVGGGRLVVNPGSVGAPKNGDPRAHYLLIDTSNGIRFEQVKVNFDVESYAAHCVSSGLPKKQADAFLKGVGA